VPILAVLAAILVISLILADNLGIGPRHAPWRARWLSRTRSWYRSHL
jgi:hypothetical protein